MRLSTAQPDLCRAHGPRDYRLARTGTCFEDRIRRSQTGVAESLLIVRRPVIDSSSAHMKFNQRQKKVLLRSEFDSDHIQLLVINLIDKGRCIARRELASASHHIGGVVNAHFPIIGSPILKAAGQFIFASVFGLITVGEASLNGAQAAAKTGALLRGMIEPIEPMMYLGIGFLLATLIGFVVSPLIHNRAVRLTMRRLEAATPLSVAEIQADKDQLRAEFAMSTRRLEMHLERFRNKDACQLAELGRRADAINRLKKINIEHGAENTEIIALTSQVEALKKRAAAVNPEYVPLVPQNWQLSRRTCGPINGQDRWAACLIFRDDISPALTRAFEGANASSFILGHQFKNGHTHPVSS